MSALSVQIADLLPVMDEHNLELRIAAAAGEWSVTVQHRRGRPGASASTARDAIWSRWYTELWQGIDAALSRIWREYGTPQEEDR